MDDLTTGDITSIVSVILVGIGVYLTFRKSRKNALTESKNEGVQEGTVESFMDATKEQLEKLNKNFSRLNERFSYFSNVVSAELGITLYLKSESPIVLTEPGEELAKEVSAKEWVDRVSGTLKEKVKDLDAYGIQDFCFEYVDKDEDQYSDEEQKVIRDSAFKRGISTYYVRQVLAIKLRDRLLEEAGLKAPK